jgi:hypothetical protein
MHNCILTYHTCSTCSFPSDSRTLKILSAAVSVLVHVVLLTVLSLLMSWGELLEEAARNNSCVITIVGYHGNSVYGVVDSIPIWVTVTSLAILVTCGRFPWKVPTDCYKDNLASFFFYFAHSLSLRLQLLGFTFKEVLDSDSAYRKFSQARDRQDT